MAAMQVLAFTFFAVTFFRGGFGVTDEEFQDLTNLVREMNEEMHEMSKNLKTQELENDRQATIIIQQGDMINRLEETLITSNRKYKQEVQETDKVQNTTIEERVSLLEIQVVDLEENVADLDEDVNFLFDEQVIQDERLLNLEETSLGIIGELDLIEDDLEGLQDTTLALDFRVTVLEENGGDDGNSSVAELEVRVETLEGTAAEHETRLTTAETDVEAMETRLTAAEENIQGLQATDVNHDARISALEENGSGGSQNDTIAFHSALTSYSTIPDESAVIFNEVLLNQGEGYDNANGVFTVPLGGDGFYYFSVNLVGDVGEFARFDMRLNDDVICSTVHDHNHSGSDDYAPGSCSAVVNVVAGDEVKVALRSFTDNTPLYANTGYLYNGFNGFRI